MAEEYNIEDQHALDALTYAVGVIKTGKEPTKDRLSAARLVLDYTKSKPASNSHVTLNSAEDFLAALAEKEAS